MRKESKKGSRFLTTYVLAMFVICRKAMRTSTIPNFKGVSK